MRPRRRWRRRAFLHTPFDRVPPRCDYQVLLLDTLGELAEFYAAGDVAFVGGSLVAVGGHNLLEPAALGVPVLSGPQQFNSPELARVLGEQGALTIVHDAAELAAALEGCWRTRRHARPREPRAAPRSPPIAVRSSACWA
jgi:3-deoxy-D-manno-octulosonic-acid transferase